MSIVYICLHHESQYLLIHADATTSLCHYQHNDLHSRYIDFYFHWNLNLTPHTQNFRYILHMKRRVYRPSGLRLHWGHQCGDSAPEVLQRLEATGEAGLWTAVLHGCRANYSDQSAEGIPPQHALNSGFGMITICPDLFLSLPLYIYITIYYYILYMWDHVDSIQWPGIVFQNLSKPSWALFTWHWWSHHLCLHFSAVGQHIPRSFSQDITEA